MELNRQTALEIYRRLHEKYPDAHIELDFSNPLELLVATVLAAQCTDVRVNQVTKSLFVRYVRAEDYLAADSAELEDDIRATGFYRQKAKSLRGIMTQLIEKHGGKVPETMEELTALPGIGRKTANVVLGNAFGVPGIAVDRHVIRVSQRLELTRHDDPAKIETDLMELCPRETWTSLGHTLIIHGRYTCTARHPKCPDCPVRDLCRYYAENVIKSS